jgi:hypothetical protein
MTREAPAFAQPQGSERLLRAAVDDLHDLLAPTPAGDVLVFLAQAAASPEQCALNHRH